MLYILKMFTIPTPFMRPNAFYFFNFPNFFFSVGNFSPAMGARNQVGIGLSYRPASQCSLATQFQTRFLELIPRPIAGLKFSTLISVFECFSSFPPFQYSFLALLTFFLLPFNLSSTHLSSILSLPFSRLYYPFQLFFILLSTVFFFSPF
jgi:hypothetical protein